MDKSYLLPILIAGSILILIFAFFLVGLLIYQIYRKHKAGIEKQQIIFDNEKKMLQAIIEEHESTMNYISAELHDNIKSSLGFTQMCMYDIEDLAVDDKQATLIESTNNIIGTVINAIHELSHSLSSNFVLANGLVETLSKQLELLQSTKKINCHIEILGERFKLAPEKEVHVYRIAQEAIQNCLKHANAANLNFELRYGHNTFTMVIQDDGVGFDQDKMSEMKGLGLQSMLQRTKLLNGLLDFQSAPSKGTITTLTLNR